MKILLVMNLRNLKKNEIINFEYHRLIVIRGQVHKATFMLDELALIWKVSKYFDPGYRRYVAIQLLFCGILLLEFFQNNTRHPCVVSIELFLKEFR